MSASDGRSETSISQEPLETGHAYQVRRLETLARRWRDKAEEIRAGAEHNNDPIARPRLFRLAETYIVLANSAELKLDSIRGREERRQKGL